MLTTMLEPQQTTEIILTVNQRLALSILRDYDKQRLKEKKTSWISPTVIPLNTWAQELWQHYYISKNCLLTNIQERYLWQNIVLNDDRYSLIQPIHTATLAQQAWETLHQWNLDITILDKNHNQEVATFITWANTFIKTCTQQSRQSQATIIQDIITSITKIPLPDSITLIGFDEYTPQQQLLITTLEQHTKVRSKNPTIEETSIKRIALNDTHDEISTMARWAKQQWQQNPEQAIGCIIPELQAHRDKIELIFTETFNPQELIKTGSNTRQTLPFNFSASRMLLQYPIINDAVATLLLSQQESHYPLTLIKQWLYSPYCQLHSSDVLAAVKIDNDLTKIGKADLPAKLILQTITLASNTFTQSTWLARWQHILNSSTNKKTLPNEWAQWIAEQLKTLSWPGGREINTEEHQLISQLKNSLTEISKLAAITTEISFSSVMNTLQDILSSTPFQPEGSDTPIQILGTLEAAGYIFDQQWIMGLSDETWPKPPKSNPFLPSTLQQQHQMPHSSAKRELDFAKTITTRLLNSSKQTIISHPTQDGDRNLLPSPLIANIALTDHSKIQLAYSANIPALKITKLIALNDFNAGALHKDEHPKGGTWILKQQASCPFKAFANIRLKIIQSTETDIGISPALSGTLIHLVLEKIWQQLKNSKNLCALSKDDLQNLIGHTVELAFIKTIRPNTQHEGFIEVEKNRIRKLIYHWLEIEKQRPPFNVVANEKKSEVKLAGITLQTSIDRIDQLQNGDLIIIDYKTQRSNINHWFGERTEEPQLPIYTIGQLDQNLAIKGIGFAQIKQGMLEFKGITNNDSEQSQNISGFKPINTTKQDISTWQECTDMWESNLNSLATEFTTGIADVKPSTINSCTYCKLQPLCRVFEK